MAKLEKFQITNVLLNRMILHYVTALQAKISTLCIKRESLKNKPQVGHNKKIINEKNLKDNNILNVVNTVTKEEPCHTFS